MTDDAPNSWRIIQCLAVTILFAIAAVWFVRVEYSLAVLKRGTSGFQLARLTSESNRDAISAPDPAILTRALAAQPLNPAIVNAAIFKLGYDSRDTRLAVAKTELLKKLGWRHTVALQNRVYAAVQRSDVPEIADIGDALLRRGVIVDEATSLMNLMERAPSTRRVVVAKLAKRPDWRESYLARVYKMQDPQQIAARARVAEDLYRINEGLDRGELYPTVKVLVAAGQTKSAYSLWRHYRRVKANPLNDPGFEWAWETRSNQMADMPFEWRAANNAGYWAEVIRKSDLNGGKPTMRLTWDLNGAPVLLSQQTALNVGPYQLVLTGNRLSPSVMDNLRFSLNCPTGNQVFRQRVSVSSRQVVLGSSDPLRCDTPEFVVVGIPRSSTIGSVRAAFGGGEPFKVELSNIALVPVASPSSVAG